MAYDYRNRRLADMTDEAVDEFYTCTLCQSFAPTHLCLVSPQRLGLCGAYNYLDCAASYQINPTGPNQPIRKGRMIDAEKGIYTGLNEIAQQKSQGSVQEVSMYSIMNSPMTACGCFECIVMLIPEANGVMVVSREDTSMTPAGMTFSTLAGMAGGGLQTPGVMGIGKYYLTSPKFISSDGGFKRVVWMSSVLKQTMAAELAEVAAARGRSRPDQQDRGRDDLHRHGRLAGLPGRERASGDDDGSDFLIRSGVKRPEGCFAMLRAACCVIREGRVARNAL